MINLLDKNTKKQFKAARRNVVWVRYNFIILAVIIGLNIVLVALISFTLFDQATAQASLEGAKGQDLKNAQSIKEKADRFRSDLAAAKTLLDANVPYSDIIATLSNAVPSGCMVKSMSIDANVYQSGKKTTDFLCKKNGREDYDIISQFITELERSLVYHEVYVQSSQTPADDPSSLQMTTVANIQDPATRIPAAIPNNCKLQALNALNHESVKPYIALVCRPSTATQGKALERKDIDDTVAKTLKDSCYFSGLEKISSTFKTYSQDYYIAHYMYTFSDINVNRKAQKIGGESVCQNEN